METTMNARELAKRLRKRLGELKKDRAKKLAAYDVAFEKWKGDLARFLRTDEVRTRILAVRKSDEDGRYGCHLGVPNFVFKDAPPRPQKPKDDTIREVQKTLRYIAFTGTPKVQVSSRQLDDWFGKLEDDEAAEDED